MSRRSEVELMAYQKKPEIVDVVAPHAWKTLNRSADYITVKECRAGVLALMGILPR